MIFLALTAWGSSPADAQKQNLCHAGWPPWQFARGMAMLGQLNDFNIHRETSETCMFGLKKGKYDIGIMTLFEFITARYDSDTVVIGVTDYSVGGDAVVLRSEIQSGAELRGKAVGLQTDTFCLYLLYLYLKKNGLTLDEIRPVHIGAENIGKAFVANRTLAGVVGWMPFIDEALANGGKLAASSRDFPEKIITMMTVRQAALQKHRGVYKDFLKKWFAAVYDPAVLEKVAEYNKKSAAEFKKSLECAYMYPDVPSALQAFPKMRETAQELQEFFKTEPANLPAAAARFFGKEPQKTDSWFDDSLLKEISQWTLPEIKNFSQRAQRAQSCRNVISSVARNLSLRPRLRTDAGDSAAYFR